MNLKKRIFIGGMLLLAVMIVIPLQDVHACSRVLWNDNGKAVVVGRTLDWFVPNPADLYILPRGIKRNGMTGENTLT